MIDRPHAVVAVEEQVAGLCVVELDDRAALRVIEAVVDTVECPIGLAIPRIIAAY